MWSRAYSATPEKPKDAVDEKKQPQSQSQSQPQPQPRPSSFTKSAVGHEKKRLEKQHLETLEAMDSQSAGRPRIGGPFTLVSSTGHSMTEQDLLGSFSLIYFGFTNCPDICPEELDKMSSVVDRIAAEHGHVINPVFVTCDPARDRVPLVAEYIADFHPKMIGLTGSYDAVKQACKAYRVYFSTPPGVDPTTDYLVDHSIFFYLMDPEGKFVDAFGKSTTEDEVHEKVQKYIRQWKGEGLLLAEANAKQNAATDGRPISQDPHLFEAPSAVPSKPPAVQSARLL
ncbi:Sco1p [Malassezia vespertilionis]|uniref:Sco1p n=1 Tax=Malassezia vespertilionis TaxID=2020962 RepID=A0A2N1JDJ6_9BASI|nr:Sco1p [Malassezia vespertilionis]